MNRASWYIFKIYYLLPSCHEYNRLVQYTQNTFQTSDSLFAPDLKSSTHYYSEMNSTCLGSCSRTVYEPYCMFSLVSYHNEHSSYSRSWNGWASLHKYEEMR